VRRRLPDEEEEEETDLIDGFVDGHSQNGGVDWNVLQDLNRVASLEVLQLR
jgi:hypothetical protein